MEAFFTSFPGFPHNPRETPEQNFRRLQESEAWPGAAYLTHRRRYFEALLDDSGSPVHRFFITQFPDFLTYDSDFPPRSEFERLRIFKNWTEDGIDEVASDMFEAALQEESSRALDTPQEEISSALDAYYSIYTDFQYDPQQPPMMEFQRLMRHQNWERQDEEYDQARGEFFEAFAEDFERYFGNNQEDITSWQQLCEDLGIEPMPATITQCRKRLQPLNINIYDLLHFKRTGAPFTQFPTVKALRKYTKKKGLVFPKAKAKGGPLRFLLRDILGGGRARAD